MSEERMSIDEIKPKGRGKKGKFKARIMPRRKLLGLPPTPKGIRAMKQKFNPEQIIARQEEAFRLRNEEGMALSEIGAKLGVTPQTISQDLKVIRKLKYVGLIEKDEMVLFEGNAKYDHINSVWYPFLKPLAEGKVIIGETKVDRKGREYDITIPTFEAAKTATEMILKNQLQRERLNGFHDTKPRPKEEEISDITTGVLLAFQRMAQQPIKAEVIENRIEDEHHE